MLARCSARALPCVRRSGARCYSTSANNKSAVRILKSRTTSAPLNLATEEWIFRTGDPSVQTLFLWRNAPTVVIGRNQNPWKECHLVQMLEDNVTLVRRQSGGGAVYQDLGNSIFTFLSNRAEYSKERNTDIVLRALSNRFGITAQASGRNDIAVNGLKISGSAFKLNNERALHHGTIMLDVDVNALEKYLNVNKEKLKSKGVTSVRSRVVNLKTINPEITHDALCDALIEEFCRTYNAPKCGVEELDPEKLLQEPIVKEHHDFLLNWDWRYGETPDFEHNVETRFQWGIVDIYFNSKDGIVTEVKVFSDCLYPQLVEALSKELKGVRYDAKGISDACARAREALRGTPSEGCIDELLPWLLKVM